MAYKQVTTTVVSDGEPFEIPDDAEVLDSVARGRAIKLFILEEAEPEQFKCGYQLDDRKTCQITVSDPDERCHHHE